MDLKSIVIGMFAGLLLSACGGASSANQESAASSGECHTPAAKLLATLDKLRQQGIMLGHQDDLAYGSMWYKDENSSDVRSVCGDYPAMFGWDISGIGSGRKLNPDSVAYSDIANYVVKADKLGGISEIRWKPLSPELSEKQFGAIADFLSGVKRDDGEAIPVVFLPFCDIDSAECNPSEFREQWQQLRAILDKKGVDNAVFAYSVNNPGSIDGFEDFYPGDRYVDVVGIELLSGGRTGVEAFKADLSRGVGLLLKFAASHKKIPAITATGMEGVKTPLFFTSDIAPFIEGKGLSYVMFWKNSFSNENYYHVPVKGHPAADDFKRFSEKKAILMCSDISKK